MSDRSRYVAITVLLILMVLGFYSNRFMYDFVESGDDILVKELPVASFFTRSISSGRWPFWNPHKICGIPFLETSFMGPYYPAVVMYFIFPLLRAINYAFLLHIIFSALFMFILCRKLGMKDLASFFCAFSWGLSSVFQHYSFNAWLPETISVSFLPGLICLFITASELKGTDRGFTCMMLGVLMALMITGGAPYSTAMIISCFILFISPELFSKKGTTCILLAAATALLLSMVYWGPIVFGQKGIAGQSRLTSGYSMLELGNFFLPTKITRAFAGKILLFLGIAGLFLKNRFSRNYRILALVSLFLMFYNKKILFFRLLDYIPVLNQDRWTWPWHTGLVFGLIVSSGFMLDKIYSSLKKNLRPAAAARGFILFILFVQFFDLYRFNSFFYGDPGSMTLNQYFRDYPLSHIFKKDTSLFRVSNRLLDFELFRKNQGTYQGIDCLESYSRAVALYNVARDSELSVETKSLRCTMTMSLCNIKYLISGEKIEDPFLEEILSVRNGRTDVRLYLNTGVLPRAFLISGQDERLITDMLLKGFEKIVLFELGPPDCPISKSTFDFLHDYRPVDITRGVNSYSISYDSDRAGFLFLSEMHHRGWSLELDGERIEITRPFNFFMGTFVPAGKHTAVFRFSPRNYRVYLTVSLLGLSAVIILGFLYIKRRIAHRA